MINCYALKHTICLGGFHQLMSFFGSIGCVMEGSGLQNALETLYSSISVNHKLTGKAYSRAIDGHFCHLQL